MGNPINAAIRSALRTAHALADVDAIYRRGENVAPIRAIKGTAEIEVVDGDGALTITRVITWQVAADKLVIQGELVEPIERDEIEQQVGKQRLIYQVQTAGGNDCFKLMEPAGEEYKITTRLRKQIT